MTLRPLLPVLITMALSGAALGAQAQFTLLATVIDPASGQPIGVVTVGLDAEGLMMQ